MEKDLVDYAYLSDNLRYADLFNGVLFGGKEVINAERLRGEDTSVFKTDLRLVFDFMKYTGSRSVMRALLQSNEAYRNVSRDAYEVMRIHTNLDELDKYIEAQGNKKEEVDMCQAIREIMAEEREQGIEQGILLHVYRMVERGRLSVQEALEDVKSEKTERDFLKEMAEAGFMIPE